MSRIYPLAFLILLMTAAAPAAAQNNGPVLTCDQLEAIYAISGHRNFPGSPEQVAFELMPKYDALSGLSLQDVLWVAATLDPPALRNTRIPAVAEKNIALFCEQFWKERMGDKPELFEKYEVIDTAQLRKNLLKLLSLEFKRVLLENSIILNGEKMTSHKALDRLKGQYNYEEMLHMLNQNVDDKAWDSRFRFAMEHAHLKF